MVIFTTYALIRAVKSCDFNPTVLCFMFLLLCHSALLIFGQTTQYLYLRGTFQFHD